MGRAICDSRARIKNNVMQVAAADAIPAGLLERIAAGESQTLEFKTPFDKASIESLVAFANAQGGTVLVGVTNAAAIQGITVGKETLNEWLGQIKSATSPSLVPELVTYSLHGKTVVSIHVAEFPVKPVSTRGRYYKRIASSNHALALNEIADLYLQSLQISWDAHIAPNASLTDLSPAKIERFIQRVNARDALPSMAAHPWPHWKNSTTSPKASPPGLPCCCLPTSH